jgi:murein DD-endopeptidase MepM/ murein hydrolase activator NlpD
MMRAATRLLTVLSLAGLMSGCQARSPEPEPSQGDILLAIDANVTDARVPRNATLAAILENHDVPVGVTTRLVSSVRQVFDPRHLRADQPYRIVRTLDGLLREFRYEINADSFLRVIAREPEALEPEFEVEVVEYPKELVTDAVETFISSDRPSLISALEGEGENLLLALQLAQAFSGLVDFNSDLRQGDRFHALFERVLRDGEFSGYGRLRAAIMENDGRRLTAIPFTVDDQEGWYDEEGRSLKRQFLSSPLPFVPTVTSGYNLNRRHPVTGSFSAHPAIDYRAAYGEKVLAVAGGRVTFAAFSGNSGRLVRIRHDGGYETMYLHLSGFKVKAGQRVEQGQVIGYVGNSGRVTGTHLDFRMRKDGRYKNPVDVFRSLPPGDPIPDALMGAFFAERDRLFQEMRDQLLDRAAPPNTRRASPSFDHN